eukprot:290697-Rhodomonas_salina.1
MPSLISFPGLLPFLRPHPQPPRTVPLHQPTAPDPKPQRSCNSFSSTPQTPTRTWLSMLSVRVKPASERPSSTSAISRSSPLELNRTCSREGEVEGERRQGKEKEREEKGRKGRVREEEGGKSVHHPLRPFTCRASVTLVSTRFLVLPCASVTAMPETSRATHNTAPALPALCTTGPLLAPLPSTT